MQPTGQSDYKQLLTNVIKKQIVILGPDITLSKARNVRGLTVADDGTVTSFEGSPQEVTQALIDQFVQLSGLIVKKTMEPLLLATQGAADSQEPPTPQLSQAPTPMPQAPLPPISPASVGEQAVSAPQQQVPAADITPQTQQESVPMPQVAQQMPQPSETASLPTPPLQPNTMDASPQSQPVHPAPETLPMQPTVSAVQSAPSPDQTQPNSEPSQQAATSGAPLQQVVPAENPLAA